MKVSLTLFRIPPWRWASNYRQNIEHTALRLVVRTLQIAQQRSTPSSLAVHTTSNESQTKASHRCLEISAFKILLQALSLSGGIHVGPNQGYRTTRNTASLIWDFDRDVFFPMSYDHFDRWELFRVHAMPLNNCTEWVFDDLENHMVLMRGVPNIRTSQGHMSISQRGPNSISQIEKHTRWLGTYMKLRSLGHTSCTEGGLNRP